MTTERPRRARVGDAGYDFFLPQDVTLHPGVWTVVDTEVSFSEGEIPEGSFMMVVPRSSMGLNYGMRFKNTIGIIDSGYRGTVVLSLTADIDVTLRKGTKAVQGIIIPFGLLKNEILPVKTRNGGMGSTGL